MMVRQKMGAYKVLPGFVGVAEFFRRLGDQFEPVKLNDARQKFYIAKIEELRGSPEDLFFNLKWCWRAESHLREARKYPNGVMMVRIDVGVIWDGLDLRRNAQSLLMAFDVEDRLLAYTVISGSGKLENCFKAETYREATDFSERHRSFAAVEEFVRTMDDGDFFYISDAASPWQFMQARADRENGKLVFTVEYSLRSFVLQFLLPRDLDAAGVLKLLSVLKAGGFVALQLAEKWKRINWRRNWSKNGKFVGVDAGILAHIYRSEILADNEAARELRDIFNTRLPGEDPLCVKIAYGTSNKMRAQLRALADDRMTYSESQRRRLSLYAKLVDF